MKSFSLSNRASSTQPPTWLRPLRRGTSSLLKHALVMGVGLFFFLPVLWMVSTSLKADKDVFRTPLSFIPRVTAKATIDGQDYPLYDVILDGQTRRLALLKVGEGKGDFVDPKDGQTYTDVRMKFATPTFQNGLRWENYPDALRRGGRPSLGVTFENYFVNSLIITFFAIIGTLLSNAMVAYAFARIKFPGREILFVLVLGTVMLPYQAIMIPQYIFFNDFLHWGNSFLPLIVPTFFANAYDIFLLRQFFRTIPDELTDAARIDGASEFGIFWRIVLPLSKPALAVVVITTFLYHWNDFQAPLIYLTSPGNYTMALGLQDFQGQRQLLWNQMMAAAVIFTLPIVVTFFFAQRTFIQGIKLTGIKE